MAKHFAHVINLKISEVQIESFSRFPVKCTILYIIPYHICLYMDMQIISMRSCFVVSLCFYRTLEVHTHAHTQTPTYRPPQHTESMIVSLDIKERDWTTWFLTSLLFLTFRFLKLRHHFILRNSTFIIL